MKKIIFILLVFIFVYIFISKKSNEKFDIVSNIVYKNSEESYKSIKDNTKTKYIDDLTMQEVPSLNCCLIEKKYSEAENINKLYGGEFKYHFNKYENEKCDSKLYNLNSNKQLFIDGDNNWSNKFCDISQNVIGSCRNINKECIDFVSKDYCDKYKMTWSEKTCNSPLPYTWKDRINRVLPEKTVAGEFRMF